MIRDRIAKLGECWSEIYQFERKFNIINNELINHCLSDHSHDSRIEMEILNMASGLVEEKNNEKIKTAYNSAEISTKEHEYFLMKFQELFGEYHKPDSTLEKNKYWLGEKLYNSARKYHNCFPKFFYYFKRKEYKQCIICIEDIRKNKIDVSREAKKIQLEYGLIKIQQRIE